MEGRESKWDNILGPITPNRSSCLILLVVLRIPVVWFVYVSLDSILIWKTPICLLVACIRSEPNNYIDKVQTTTWQTSNWKKTTEGHNIHTYIAILVKKAGYFQLPFCVTGTVTLFSSKMSLWVWTKKPCLKDVYKGRTYNIILNGPKQSLTGQDMIF